MSIKILALLAILKLSASMPDPNVNVNVNIDVNVGDKGGPKEGPKGGLEDDNGKNREDCKVAGGKWQLKSTNCTGKLLEGRQWCSFPKLYVCCVPPPPGSCVFGDKTYHNGTFLEESCQPVQCINGSWIFLQAARTPDCGLCSAESRSDHPFIYTYEPHNVTDGSGDSEINRYTYGGIGSYSLTQPGLNIPAPFYVYVKFDLDPNYYNSDETYFQSAIYYEPGITVEFQTYKVFVNGIQVIFDDSTSSSFDSPAVYKGIPFSATSGTVLVTEMSPFLDSSCRVLVGSKGLSLSYCYAARSSSAHLSVYATPSLKYQLNGLCDVFTGGALPHPECYIDQNGNCQSDSNIFADSWQV